MRVILRPLEMLLVMVDSLTSAIMTPLEKWLSDRPSLDWWLGIFRLGLFQFGVGLCLAPISGALNRVLITDLHIPAVAVGFLIAIHYFVSPVRAMIGYRSDRARSQGRWRTPYVVFGVMLAFGGLSCAPFALILLSGEGVLSFPLAMVVCALIFLAYGIGLNIVETIYLALVSDVTPPKQRGPVLAILWTMLVLGTVVSGIIVSALLVEYSHQRLIQVMQGSALVFIFLTVVSLWKQERMRPDGKLISEMTTVRVRLSLWDSLKGLSQNKLLQRLFLLIFLATMAFATHDVLLEPYGGEVLGMSVSSTMQLTALWGIMTIVGVATAAWLLWKPKQSPTTLIGLGCMLGVGGFGIISIASDAMLVDPFRWGVAFISMGRGIFIVGSIILVMSLTDIAHAGLFLGVWGIVQAMAQGFGVIGGSLARDVIHALTGNVALGYTAVYGTSLAVLAIVLMLLASRFASELRVDNIRMPWDGLEEIPADQLTF